MTKLFLVSINQLVKLNFRPLPGLKKEFKKNLNLKEAVFPGGLWQEAKSCMPEKMDVLASREKFYY